MPKNFVLKSENMHQHLELDKTKHGAIIVLVVICLVGSVGDLLGLQ